MRLERKTLPNRQRGFSLLAAIFLITVLALLVGYLVSTSGSAQQTPIAALQTSKTYHAARAGLEWGIFQAVNNGGVGVSPDPCNGNFTLNSGGFSGEQVAVSCSSTQHRDGTPSVELQVYYITAVATTGTEGSLTYARRELRAVVSPTGPQ